MMPETQWPTPVEVMLECFAFHGEMVLSAQTVTAYFYFSVEQRLPQLARRLSRSVASMMPLVELLSQTIENRPDLFREVVGRRNSRGTNDIFVEFVGPFINCWSGAGDFYVPADVTDADAEISPKDSGRNPRHNRRQRKMKRRRETEEGDKDSAEEIGGMIKRLRR